MLILLLVLGLSGIALYFWMRYEANQHEINRHDVHIGKPLSRPLKILHLTDTHFASPKPSLSRFFDDLAKEEVDFVFLTGDIMDCNAGIKECVKQLNKLKPKVGIFAVYGNHDYFDYGFVDVFIHNFPGQTKPLLFNNIETFKQELEKIGVVLLRNQTAALDVEGMPLLIHGMDDATTGHANVRRTLENYDETKINLLLTHTVDVFLDIGKGEIDVSFSGHSHGGQFRFPFIGPIVTHTTLGRPFASGIHKIQEAVCCISRGLNSNRNLQLRLLCRPEAIVLTVYGS